MAFCNKDVSCQHTCGRQDDHGGACDCYRESCKDSKDYKLKSPKVYLAGGIELAGKIGKSWRDKVKEKFANKGYIAFHPYETESHILNKFGFKNNKQLIKAKYSNLDAYCQCMREIIYYDITNLAQSKVVFVHLDASCREGTGTCGELTIAKDMLIPIVGVINYNDIKKIAGWAIACCDFRFKDFDEAINKTIEILGK